MRTLPRASFATRANTGGMSCAGNRRQASLNQAGNSAQTPVEKKRREHTGRRLSPLPSAAKRLIWPYRAYGFSPFVSATLRPAESAGRPSSSGKFLTLNAASSCSVWPRKVFVSGFICESARTAAGTFFGQSAFHSSTVDISLALSMSNSASTKRSRSASLSCASQALIVWSR